MSLGEERAGLGTRFHAWVRSFFSRDLGRAGEAAAECFLRSRGLFPVARNWRARRGELDLVLVTPSDRLVFVEVKTTLRSYEEAWSRVGPEKEGHLEAVAHEFLRAHGLPLDREYRFDVVVVLGDPRSLRKPLRFYWSRNVF